jgi:hypothetical protein
MKLAFLLGSPDISGGTYVIFEHATRLNRMGYPVTIVTEGQVDEARFNWHPAAGELTWRTFEEIEKEPFDLAIATWWQSVYHLARIRSRKYLYFIQSIESRFFAARDPEDPGLRDIDILSEWCENTYRISLPVITEARWIQNYLLEHHNRSSLLVRNGIRKDIYAESGPVIAERQPGRLRVLVEGPLGVFFKNVEKTITLCWQAGVDEIWLLTSSEVSTYPGVDRCFSRVPILQTAEIYRSCDVLVKLSYVEGMFGPPLEMFHCGGTAIVYDVTGHDEYIHHDKNSLVVERENEPQVVAWLKRLKSDADLLGRLKEGARRTALGWPDWDVAADEFRQAIEHYDRKLLDMSVSFLLENCNTMIAARDNALRSRELARLAEREQSGGDPSLSFLNHIQVYWDGGRGMEAVLTDRYQSGSWCRCSVIVPCGSAPKVLRVDPSVRMGIVEVRSLSVSGTESGATFARWQEGSSWHDVAVAGTAKSLQLAPYPILEAYGEDPQLFLPNLPNLPDGERIRIEIEVRERGFAQALGLSHGIERGGQAKSGLGMLKYFGTRLLAKLRGS